MESIIQTRVLLPAKLLFEIDKIAGKRRRSVFFVEAAKERLANLTLLKALNETAGGIQIDDHPEWKTRNDTSFWVSAIRKVDEEVRRGYHGIFTIIRERRISCSDDC